MNYNYTYIRKEQVVIMTSVLKVILLVLLSVVLLGPGYAEQQGPTPVGRVVWVKGDSFKAMSASNEQRVLQKTAEIFLHDTLLTDENTQAEIVFTDNTLMTFHPGSKFTIDNYAYKPGEKGSVGKSVMSLIEGGFRTITGLIAKSNPSDYAVHTPVATIGVRGTDYTVQLKGGEMYIGFNHGSPCVKSNKNSSELCLDEKTPYAKVASAESAPQGLQQKPAVFKDETEVTPAKIAGFGSVGSGGAGGSRGGTTTSFCISQ